MPADNRLIHDIVLTRLRIPLRQLGLALEPKADDRGDPDRVDRVDGDGLSISVVCSRPGKNTDSNCLIKAAPASKPT